eukprot:scaffold28375_cov30-Attheya_sp.AAC.1
MASTNQPNRPKTRKAAGLSDLKVFLEQHPAASQMVEAGKKRNLLTTRRFIKRPMKSRSAIEGDHVKKLVDAGMVRVQGLTTFSDTVDFVRAVDNGNNRRSLPGGAKVAVAHDDETEVWVSPYSPPVSVELPPRLPPTRLGHSTQAAGVVEQYERKQPDNNKNVARSFWPGTAREVYPLSGDRWNHGVCSQFPVLTSVSL